MIKYNVTIKIDRDVQEDWLQWMAEEHIPEVMNTGLFVNYSMSKLLFQDSADGDTFVMQYDCPSIEDLNLYFDSFAQAIQKKHSDLYKGKFVAFRTIMGVIEKENMS